MRRNAKTFIFDTKEEAMRFKTYYSGGFVQCNDYFYNKYYGPKVFDKWLVIAYTTKEAVDEWIESLDFKEKRFNGKKVYVF